MDWPSYARDLERSARHIAIVRAIVFLAFGLSIGFGVMLGFGAYIAVALVAAFIGGALVRCHG